MLDTAHIENLCGITEALKTELHKNKTSYNNWGRYGAGYWHYDNNTTCWAIGIGVGRTHVKIQKENGEFIEYICCDWNTELVDISQDFTAIRGNKLTMKL